MKTILFTMITAACLANSAFGTDACPDGKDFFLEIYNCGANTLAAEKARTCAKESIQAIRARAKDLDKEMAQMRKGDAQNLSMRDVRARLTLAATELTQEIRAMQANAATVKAYPDFMIDLPDGVDDNSSLPCFSSVFHELQGTLREMEKEILNAKRAKKAAVDMLRATSGSQTSLKSFGNGRVISSEPTRQNLKAGPKGPEWNKSTISEREPRKPLAK